MEIEESSRWRRESERASEGKRTRKKRSEEGENANRVYERVELKKDEQEYGMSKSSDERWCEFAVLQDEVGMAFGRGRRGCSSRRTQLVTDLVWFLCRRLGGKADIRQWEAFCHGRYLSAADRCWPSTRVDSFLDAYQPISACGHIHRPGFGLPSPRDLSPDASSSSHFLTSCWRDCRLR